jgi:hypothetical protein
MLVAGPTVMQQYLGMRRADNGEKRATTQYGREARRDEIKKVAMLFYLLPRVNPINGGRVILSVYDYSGLSHERWNNLRSRSRPENESQGKSRKSSSLWNSRRRRKASSLKEMEIWPNWIQFGVNSQNINRPSLTSKKTAIA